MYSIYGDGGLRGSINFSRSLLGLFKRPSFNFAKELTNDFLSQEALIEDDFLSLRYQDFERLIIFDRKPWESTGNPLENANKRLFLKLLHIVISMLVQLDDDSRGIYGIVKPIKRPMQ